MAIAVGTRVRVIYQGHTSSHHIDGSLMEQYNGVGPVVVRGLDGQAIIPERRVIVVSVKAPRED